MVNITKQSPCYFILWLIFRIILYFLFLYPDDQDTLSRYHFLNFRSDMMRKAKRTCNLLQEFRLVLTDDRFLALKFADRVSVASSSMDQQKTATGGRTTGPERAEKHPRALPHPRAPARASRGQLIEPGPSARRPRGARPREPNRAPQQPLQLQLPPVACRLLPTDHPSPDRVRPSAARSRANRARISNPSDPRHRARAVYGYPTKPPVSQATVQAVTSCHPHGTRLSFPPRTGEGIRRASAPICLPIRG